MSEWSLGWAKGDEKEEQMERAKEQSKDRKMGRVLDLMTEDLLESWSGRWRGPVWEGSKGGRKVASLGRSWVRGSGIARGQRSDKELVSHWGILLGWQSVSEWGRWCESQSE
jgi:hypothetical protein